MKRKEYPIYSGVIRYFPDAIMEVAHVSYVGNEQHNPGEPLHWAREKSRDQEDALMRHLVEAGTIDDDGIRHTAKVAWRALAMLQLELEEEGATEVAAVVKAADELIQKEATATPEFQFELRKRYEDAKAALDRRVKELQ